VNVFAKLVSIIIRDGKTPEESDHYRFAYFSSAITDTPELNILRVEKEIRDMAGVVSSMYTSFSNLVLNLHEVGDREGAVATFCDIVKRKEDYADEMRESLTAFLIECTREQLNIRSEKRVSQLLRVIAELEEMSDECYGISRLLERSVRKNRIFKIEEVEDLVPYISLVDEFLGLLQEHLGKTMSDELVARAMELEADINKLRRKLQKFSRKRIEAGEDIKTELIFIDLVQRIEKLGDYCIGITEKISS
jgi:phosphate:Na+ symporter